MFIVSPIQTADEREALCKRLGADFHIGDMAYRVTVNEREAGIVTFFIKGKTANLRQIVFYPQERDFEVMFIAGRACMEFMDRVGATDGYFISPDPENRRLTLALGYKQLDNGQWYLDTTGFFEEHCKHHRES